MRVCFVSRRFFPTISGMSTYALNLVRQLAAADHDVVMVSQYRGDELGRRVYGGGPPPAVDGVDVRGLESIGEQKGGDFEHDVAAMVDAITAAHREAPLDVVHAQYAYPTGLAALEAGSRLGVPVVVSIQGGDGHWVGGCCGTHRRAMDAVLAGAGALLVGSPSFAEVVVRNHGVAHEALTVVPGGTDTTRFTPASDRELGALSDPVPVLLCHGRVDRRKGALDLLDAVALLRRPARLVVSGIGPDLDAAQTRARELGLADRVTFTGHVAYEDAPAVYRSADVFVSPTWAEGFSNTILEAMASGLPIVSTAVVGIVDALTDERDGLLVGAQDPPALAAALDRLLDDAALRRRLAETALHEVRTRYSWEAVAGQIADVYGRVGPPPPRATWDVDRTVEPCRFRAEPHLL